MAKKTKIDRDPEMSSEYDFSKGVRGKFAKRFQSAILKGVIVLEPELLCIFPDSAAVNEALRTLIRIAGPKGGETTRSRRPSKKSRKAA